MKAYCPYSPTYLPTYLQAGKFPTTIGAGDKLQEKIETVKATIKFQMKKVGR